MGLSNLLRAVLKKLSEAFRKQHAPNSGGPTERHSRLTRFVFDRRKFRTHPDMVPLPGAFLPDSTLKTSALGMNDLTENEVWAIGRLIGGLREKPPKARADFGIDAVLEARLTIERDPQPGIPTHVNLCGWPNEKDEQKSVAQLLCIRARLLLVPPAIQSRSEQA